MGIAQTWSKKQEQMWAKVNADNSLGPPPDVKKIMVESIQTSFDDEWDHTPVGRTKYIHPNGAVCPFVVDIKDSPFTGLFQDGQTHGGGVKFFRTGRSSGNFVILNQLQPIADNNYNFFSVPLSNQIPDNAPVFAIKFCQAQDCVTKVGLSDVCRYDQEGNEVQDIVFPYKVTFMPTGAVNFREEPSTKVEFYKQFDYRYWNSYL